MITIVLSKLVTKLQRLKTMGKIKSFLIQALDNGEDPFYNLQKIKEGVDRDKSKKEKKLDSKGFVDQSGLQNQESKRQAKA